MIPVDQTRFAAGPDPKIIPAAERGNCMQAAMASLLELPLDDVVNFIEVDTPDDWPEDAVQPWFLAMRDWLGERGFRILCCVEPLADTFGIMSGRSPRGDWGHCVVALGGEVAHDPHPSRDGVIAPDEWWYLVPFDPAVAGLAAERAAS